MIVNNQISLSKTYKQDTKVISEKTINNQNNKANTSIIIKLEVDLEK